MNQDRGNSRNVKLINANVINYTQEDLQGMNDDRLSAIKEMLKGKIYALSKMQNDPEACKKLMEFQVEHSYVSRELEVRQKRKVMHEQYLQKIRGNRPPRRRHYNNRRTT